jgi:hypothetical protein
MPSALDRPSFMANGNINPRSFVKLDATGNGKEVIACGAGERMLGVSGEGTVQVPIEGASTYHATDGLPCEVRLPGEEAMLRLGTGGATTGYMLKSDASGYGVSAEGDTFGAATPIWVGAIALRTGLVDEFIEVFVVLIAV